MLRPLPAAGGGGILGAVAASTFQRWLDGPSRSNRAIPVDVCHCDPTFPLADESAFSLVGEALGRLPVAGLVLLAFFLFAAAAALAFAFLGGVLGYLCAVARRGGPPQFAAPLAAPYRFRPVQVR